MNIKQTILSGLLIGIPIMTNAQYGESINILQSETLDNKSINISGKLVSKWFAQINDTTSISKLMQYATQLSLQHCRESYMKKWWCLVKLFIGKNEFHCTYIHEKDSEELIISYLSNSHKDVDQTHIIKYHKWWSVKYGWLRIIYEQKQEQIKSIGDIVPIEYRIVIITTENLSHYAKRILQLLEQKKDR